jgi:formate/nitrite transporter FocA (FNT family)
VPAPQPEEIYKRTKEEGRRRLSRPVLELGATAVVGGFDVAVGLAIFFLTSAELEPKIGVNAAHFVGAIGFGIGFVFIVVGRSELFAENFLVPITGLTKARSSWLKLGELWVISLVLNLAGGALLAIVLTSHGVLRPGSREAAVRLADNLASYSPGTAILSGLVAGALMTVLTWFVEGAAESMGVRIVMAWIVGFVLVLGSFDHAIVGTMEMIYGMRAGADVGYDQLFSNLGLAVASNLVGGLVLVTFARSAQALGASPD